MERNIKATDNIALNRVDLSISTRERNPFLDNLADADLSLEQIKEAIALMAEAEAKRYDEEADIVNRSVEGVGHLTGTATFETRRANNLRKLAKTIRKL
jgi:hypothetical protein